MVFLKEKGTHFKEKEEPFTSAWDNNMRKHYAFYQDLIDQNTYKLQKGLKGLGIFGHMNYPYRLQHRYMLLELYKKKQYLGEVQDEEIERYSKVHGDIRKDLGTTFNNTS